MKRDLTSKLHSYTALLIRRVRFLTVMTGFFIGIIVVFFLFVGLLAVWSRWRRQMGGGLGPTELSDGRMTTTPTGCPEEMHGHAKDISPVENKAAKL